MKSIIGALGITKLISTAFNSISNSMDSAIDRLDTMNNFPKVMSNLGISAKESDEAIQDLSNGLKGLPTTLDSGALAVQRFTSKNGDVKKSTNLFLALNNAILAGGASTQIQESALEQLSQAYAKGKPDMMEWRTAQMAMPAQLKQIATQMLGNKDALGQYLEKAKEYAKNNPLSSTAGELIEQLEAVSNGTGDMTTALGTGLRTGIISMDDFMDTIVQMNKTGTNNIKSFEEQAKNATGGIKTNITNMKTAIARGVANIISSLDKALKKANLKGVGESIKSVGTIAEKALNNISKAIEKINFKTVLDILKKIAPVVTTVVTAFIAYESTLKAIQVINFVKDIKSATQVFLGLVPAIKSATVSQTALNMAQAVSPVGLLVAGVTALIGGLLLLSKAADDSSSKYNQVNKSLNDYNKAMKEADNARQEYLDKNMNELNYYENLASELKNITDENGKVQEGYEKRAEFIATTLNDALGTEITITDGVVQKYEELENKIKGIIEQKRAQYLLEAQEEKYNTAKDQRNKLEEAYTTALENNREKIKAKKQTEEELCKQYGLTSEQLLRLKNSNFTYAQELGMTDSQYRSIIQVLGKADSEYKQSIETLNEAGATYKNNEEIIAQYENALGYMADKNYESVLKIYEDTTNYIGKTDEQTYKNYQTAIDRQKLYLDNLKADKDKYDEDTYNSMVSSGEAQLTELVNQQAKYKVATDEGQNQCANATKSGQKKVKDIWKMSLEDQVKTLQDKKVEFRKTSDGHIQAYIDGQKSGKPKSVKEANNFAKSIQDEIAKSKNNASQSGKDVVAGFNAGFNSSKGSSFSIVASYGASILSTLKNALKEHSPSKATAEMGLNAVKGFEIGWDKEEGKVLKQVTNFGDDVLDRFSNAVSIETGKMSFAGTSCSVSQILSANAQFEGTIPIEVDLDGEKIYSNQQKVSARKSLQYGGVK